MYFSLQTCNAKLGNTQLHAPIYYMKYTYGTLHVLMKGKNPPPLVKLHNLANLTFIVNVELLTTSKVM